MRRSILALFLVAAACVQPSPKPASLPTPASTSRVVLISFDGLSANEVAHRSENGEFSAAGVQGMLDNGLSARVIPVNPTLTAVTHISIATGTTPERHGIVSNTFHMPGLGPNVGTTGFEAPIEAETIWEAVHRAGKKVGAITFPGLDGTNSRRSADWGLLYTSSISKPKIVTLHRTDFTSEWLPPGWAPDAGSNSYSPLMKATLEWSFVVSGKPISRDVTLIASDSTDDGKENYDGFSVEMNSQEIALDANRWFPLSESLPNDGATWLFGSWSKILRFDPDLESVTVYWGAVARNEAYPQSYREMIDSSVGFWPSPPDDNFAKEWLAGREGVDPATYDEQIDRFSDYFTRATVVSMQRMPFDLLLGYQPIIDSAYHQFYLVNDRQAYSTTETRAAGALVRNDAYSAFDRAIARIRATLSGDSTLVICGDHGMAAGDTRVSVNELLADWGFAKREGEKLASDTPWSAFVHGSYAQFYRFVPREVARENQLINRLRQLRSPDGDLVFEKVELSPHGANPRMGDVIAYAYPRFTLTPYLGMEVFDRPASYGYHGALNTHAEFNTMLLAVGPSLTRQKLGTVSQTSIARFVSGLLGIDPPHDAQ